jgi:RNA-directed DNA polymerase
MDETDADKRAGMPEDHRKVVGGTGEKRVRERQASTAVKEKTQPEAEKLLEEVLRRENMLSALRRVRSNKGAPGIDGMTVEELVPYLKREWPRIREELLKGTYQPAPARQVEIPKPSGNGVRPLGIPTVLDRMIQQAILQVLTPIFDPHFSNSSYGFRPGRCCQDAVVAAQGYVGSGCRFVVDLDLEKFFDRVNHDVLMARVARRVKDKRLLRLLRRYLESGVMVGGVIQEREEGTPQGGPLSPLLSNIILDDLDKELERRGHRFCRYADDCNIYVKSKAAGERVMESIARFLERRLRLKVNREKSAVDRPWRREFLGYTMTWHRQPRLKVSPDSIQRIMAKIRELTREARGCSLTKVIGELTPLLRGWINYFWLSSVKIAFEQLDEWIRRRLRCVIWRHWKKPYTRAKKLIQRGIERETAFISAYNGRGAWWNSGASHMHSAFPVRWFTQQGLISLLSQHRRFQNSSRTAVCRPARTVV